MPVLQERKKYNDFDNDIIQSDIGTWREFLLPMYRSDNHVRLAVKQASAVNILSLAAFVFATVYAYRASTSGDLARVIFGLVCGALNLYLLLRGTRYVLDLLLAGNIGKFCLMLLQRPFINEKYKEMRALLHEHGAGMAHIIKRKEYYELAYYHKRIWGLSWLRFDDNGAENRNPSVKGKGHTPQSIVPLAIEKGKDSDKDKRRALHAALEDAIRQFLDEMFEDAKDE